MLVLKINPGKKPVAKDLKPDFDSIRDEIGGWIELVHPFQDRKIVCIIDDEGRLKGLPLNVHLGGHSLFGPIIICREDDNPDSETGLLGLIPSELVKYAGYFDPAHREPLPSDSTIPPFVVKTFDTEEQLMAALDSSRTLTDKLREK